MNIQEIECRVRTDTGRVKVRRGRREGKIPSVLYGGGAENVKLWIAEEDASRVVSDQIRVLSLNLGEDGIQVMVKEIQYDTFGDFVLHMDFRRLKAGEKMEVHIPILLKGIPVGVKEGGNIEQHLRALTILADPANLPRQLEADVSGMHLGDVLKAGEIPLPEGSELIQSPDERVALVAAPEEEKEPEEPEELKEPEVTGKTGKKTGEEEEQEKE